MTATKKFSDVKEHPSIEAFQKGKGRWELMPPEGPATTCLDWSCTSPFGSVESAVVLASDGSPQFDRPVYREAPNVNVVAWGKDGDGAVKIAVIRQPRPHADDPEKPGNDHEALVFGQVPMGFLEKIIGKDMLERIERPDLGAVREVGEETGAGAVINVTRPEYPYQNPNPTFVATWSQLFFVEVDLAKVEALKEDRSEPIFSAEYVSVPELLKRIRDGKDEKGAVYRMGISNALWMVFFANHPELFTAK